MFASACRRPSGRPARSRRSPCGPCARNRFGCRAPARSLRRCRPILPSCGGEQRASPSGRSRSRSARRPRRPTGRSRGRGRAEHDQLVSDGLAISTPVSAATADRMPGCAQQRDGHHRLGQQHRRSGAEDDRPVARSAPARSMLMPTVIRKMPSARPGSGAVITSTSP